MPLVNATASLTNVLYLSAEDDLEDTLVPRLQVAGADLDRVHFGPDGWIPALPHDAPVLGELIGDYRIGLLVLDPGVAFLASDHNSFRDQDVRNAFAALRSELTAHGCAALVIRHLNKQVHQGNPLYRGGGSIGWIGAMRLGFLVAEDREDPEVRVFACTKSNLGPKPPSLRFRLVTDRGWGVEAPRIEWVGESEMSASDLIAMTPGSNRRGPERVACAEWLRKRLRGGTAVAREALVSEAAELGWSESVLKRAADDVGIEIEAIPGAMPRRTLWSLR